MLDKKLLSILACPVCKGALRYDRQASELICLVDAIAFPIKDDIPVMLSSETRELTLEEREKY